MKRNHLQYTLRGVSEPLDKALRRQALQEGKSLNQMALELLARGAGLGEEPVLYDDLDPLAGTWVEDKEFEEAIRAQDRVDPQRWK